MNPQLTPDTTTMVTAVLTGIVPALSTKFIDQDAATGTPEWYVAVAAANLRDAAALLHGCLQDAGYLTEDTRRAGLTEDRHA